MKIRNNLARLGFLGLLLGNGIISQAAIAGIPPIRTHKFLLQVDSPTFSGSGCPDGTASILLDMDKQSITVLFDQFSLQVGKSSRRQVSTQECTLYLPITLEPGYSLSVTNIDYRGFASLPERASLQLNISHRFFSGKFMGFSGSSHKVVHGPTDTDFQVTDDAKFRGFSFCGKTVDLVSDVVMRVIANRPDEDVLASLDSADAHTNERPGFIYSFDITRCPPASQIDPSKFVFP